MSHSGAQIYCAQHSEYGCPLCIGGNVVQLLWLLPLFVLLVLRLVVLCTFGLALAVVHGLVGGFKAAYRGNWV